MPDPTATAARCACRPACLSTLRNADVTIRTPAGRALHAHLHPTTVYLEIVTSPTSPLSVVGVK